MEILAYWRPILVPVANAYGLDSRLLEAVVWVESKGKADAFRHEPNFWLRYMAKTPEWKDHNPRRVSSSYGLTQIMFLVAWELGFRGEPEELFLPKTNLHWGARKLRTLLDWANGPTYMKFSPQLRQMAAIAAYNGGRGGNTPGSSPLRNSQYAERVNAAYRLATGQSEEREA